MRTIDMMSARDLADLRDAGRGHLIDGAGPLLEKADELRKQEREEGWGITKDGDGGSAGVWPDGEGIAPPSPPMTEE